MPAQTLGKIEVHTFPLPPKGFDPLHASAQDLQRHGFPRHPDPIKEPRAAGRWVEAFRHYREFTHVIPEFTERPDHVHGPNRRTIKNSQGQLNATSSNWSGEVAFVGGGDKFEWIVGAWTVPHVYAIPGATGTDYSSAWLGIDGDGSGDVMQAGTESDSDGSCYAWWEWYPNYEVAIPNFPVAFGDAITLLLCSTGASTAWMSIGNLTSKHYTSFSFSAPSGTTLVGNCAEAVMERPGVGGALAELPRYGLIEFNDVVAYSQKSSGPIAAGTPLSMVADDGVTVISAPDPESGDPDSFVTGYTGP